MKVEWDSQDVATARKYVNDDVMIDYLVCLKLKR